MSSNSSSPEAAANLAILDMPMFFPSEATSIYHQLLDIDGSSDLLLQNQNQNQNQYQAYATAQQQKQQFQHNVTRIGHLDTPPTSPPTPAFQKYPGCGGEIGTIQYSSQPQAIQNVYVIPSRPVTLPQYQQHQLPYSYQQPQQLTADQQRQQQEHLEYLALMRQFDNLESPLSSSSPTTSSCSSSLTNSPFAESPLMAICPDDFDLFPMSTGAAGVQQATTGYPSCPLMAPSVAAQSFYGQQGVYQHQMTPPMNQMDLEREVSSLFKQDSAVAGSNAGQPLTTELSLLCMCPGKFPCGEQLPDETSESTESSDSVSRISSPLQDIRESELSEEESGSEEEQQEDQEQEFDPSYVPTHARTSKASRAKSMFITISGAAPYSSPYSRDSSLSPKTPTRQDRRRSSSGSFSTFGGHSHNQQLLAPELIPEIKDIHVCPVCQRRFTRPFNLRSHLMTHTTARPFPCDECHWKFTRQHDLLRHKRAKHPNSVNNSITSGQDEDSVTESAA